MENLEKFIGYDAGYDDGYCGITPKFSLCEKSNPFVAGYIEGYVDGGEFRDIIESQLKKQYKTDDFEMRKILNQRKIKF
jgi:hypothetical protein